MASLTPEPGPSSAAPVTTASKSGKLCGKCRTSAPKLKLPPSLLLCGPCARKGLDHKSRLGLELARGAALKGRIDRARAGMKEGDKGMKGRRINDMVEGGAVAMGFSGGPSSRALLHLARSYLLPNASTSSNRPMDVTRLLVLFIDDASLFPDAQSRVEEARQIVESEEGEAFGVEFVPLRLEDVFEGEGAEEGDVCDLQWEGDAPTLASSLRQASKVSSLKALLDLSQLPGPSRSTPAARRTIIEDLHSSLIQSLLRREARRRGCRALLIGESGTRMASNLVDGLAKGRGFGLPVQDGFAYWNEDLLVLRPLREALAKEIAYFNQTSGLQSLTPLDPVAQLVLNEKGGEPSQAARDKSSMSRLTESFVRLLEKGVPSTVSTINRTSAKLTFGLDDALPSSSGDGGAQVVGPSVPLRAMNRARAEAEAEAGQDRPAGLGGSALRLIQSVEALPMWDGKDACAFCGAPSDPRGLLGKGKEATRAEKRERLDLAAALCYACLRTFEAPDEDGGRVVPLPSWVLEGVRKRAGRGKEGGESEAEDVQPAAGDAAAIDAEDALHEAADGGRREGMVNGDGRIRQVDREEMRESLGSFLLEE